MVLDPIPPSLPVHFFGSRPQPPTSPLTCWSEVLRLVNTKSAPLHDRSQGAYTLHEESCYASMGYVTHKWILTVWMKHVTYKIYIYMMSHVTYEWVMSHTNESRHIWNQSCHVCMKKKSCHVGISHGWVMSRMNETCHIWISHVTYEWVMSHMNESCPLRISRVTYDWVT